MANSTSETNPQQGYGLVSFETSQGAEFQGNAVRLDHHRVVFEIYTPAAILRVSDVLPNFRIIIGESVAYSGRAVVSKTINTGAVLVCEVELDEAGLDVSPLDSSVGNGAFISDRFKKFLDQWQALYHVRPEFKQVVGDLQSFLTDLRLWLNRVELEIRSAPSGDRLELEQNVIKELASPVVRGIDTFIDRFETIAASIEPDLQPVHRIYLRRQLHPLLLSSPFAYRTIYKPLGYAGDYEVVDMMMRPPYEGSSLFAKVINVWLLEQAPALAHRNRVDYLSCKLLEEAARAKSRGRIGRVYNLGCGPAAEIQRFLRDQHVSNELEFTLLDFNEETLSHARVTLEGLKRAHGRSTRIQLLKRSVQQLLKEAGKPVHRVSENQYDFIYCAGLFDYLSDAVCKRLMNAFYDVLAPGGLLVATNVSDAMNQSRPFRYSMEYILDWFLIYRDGPRFGTLVPDRVPHDCRRVISEESGVNMFIEVRKPING